MTRLLLVFTAGLAAGYGLSSTSGPSLPTRGGGLSIVGDRSPKSDPGPHPGLTEVPAPAAYPSAAGDSGGAGDQRQAGGGSRRPPGRDAEPLSNAGAASAKTGSPALLSALIAVESGGNPNAVGDNGRAVGILQIHPIMVADCQRLAPAENFTLADRLSPERSVAMFNVWRAHYCKDASDEVVARRWNGGGRGERKAATAGYWQKVRKEMEATQ